MQRSRGNAPRAPAQGKDMSESHDDARHALSQLERRVGEGYIVQRTLRLLAISEPSFDRRSRTASRSMRKSATPLLHSTKTKPKPHASLSVFVSVSVSVSWSASSAIHTLLHIRCAAGLHSSCCRATPEPAVTTLCLAATPYRPGPVNATARLRSPDLAAAST